MNMQLLIFRSIILSLIFSSCVDHDLSPELPAKGDYFPLNKNMYWEYKVVRKYKCNCPDPEQITTYMTTVKVNEDFDEQFGGDNKYFLLEDDNPDFFLLTLLIRKDGTKFFEMPPYNYEYMFMDSSKPLHAKWVDGGYGYYTVNEHEITAVNAVRTVNGITYENVIEVTKSLYRKNDHNGEYQLFSQTVNWYAKDVGKIYSFFSYSPQIDGSTTEVILMNYGTK